MTMPNPEAMQPPEKCPKCQCGKPATCYGMYEAITGYGCDDCCGHGNEDGWCEPIGDASLTAQLAACRAECEGLRERAAELEEYRNRYNAWLANQIASMSCLDRRLSGICAAYDRAMEDECALTPPEAP